MNTPHSNPEDDPILPTVSPQALIPANFTMDAQLDSDDHPDHPDHLEIDDGEHNTNDLWLSGHSLSSMSSPADHPLVASSTAAEHGTTTTTTTTVSTPLVVDIALAPASHTTTTSSSSSSSSPEYYSIQGEASDTSSSSAAAATLLPASDGSRRTKGRWPPKRAYSLVGTMASCFLFFLKKNCKKKTLHGF